MAFKSTETRKRWKHKRTILPHAEKSRLNKDCKTIYICCIVIGKRSSVVFDRVYLYHDLSAPGQSSCVSFFVFFAHVLQAHSSLQLVFIETFSVYTFCFFFSASWQQSRKEVRQFYFLKLLFQFIYFTIQTMRNKYRG